jgi:hypothetical protein
VPALLPLIAGAGTMAVCCIFGRRVPRAVGFFGALALVVGAFGCFFQQTSALHAPLLSTIAVAVLLGFAWMRTRDWVAVLPGAGMVGLEIYLWVRDVRGWPFIALSFILLALGAVASLRKGRRANAGPDNRES